MKNSFPKTKGLVKSGIVVHFADPLSVWFNRRQRDSQTHFCIQTVEIVHVKIWPHTYLYLGEGNVLMAFSYNCGYSLI